MALVIDNGQCVDDRCPHCARIWLQWFAARMRQMHAPRKKKGETVSFAEAAATSNIPPKDSL